MGFMLRMKITLLLFLVSASLFFFSYAGRSSFMENPSVEMSFNKEETSGEYLRLRHDKGSDVHERLLRFNTKDYGTYDPAPTLHKPPFKLIPN